MAGGTTPPGDATRFIETKQGVLTYSQLAPLLAERVLKVELKIESGEYSSSRLDADLIAGFHSEIARDLVDWAGRWRSINVTVSQHHPPSPEQLPMTVRNYVDDLNTRIDHLSSAGEDLLLEGLAFAEGRFLSIHPFQDFNGRVARLLLREMLRRLELPAVALAPSDEIEKALYLKALAAADQLNWLPLVAVWKRRLSTTS